MGTETKTEEEEPEGPEAKEKGCGCPGRQGKRMLKGGDRMPELQKSNTCVMV